MNSFIVRKRDAARLQRWLLKQKENAPGLDGYYSISDVLFGEFPWAEAYRHLTSLWRDPDGWDSDAFRGKPAPMLPTAAQYSAKVSEYDNSLAEAFTCYLPCAKLVHGMALHHSHLDGRWRDKNGQIVFFDPGVSHADVPSLLGRSVTLNDHLASSGYGMIWVVTGWKCMLGGRSHLDGAFLGDLRTLGVYRRLQAGWYGETVFTHMAPDRTVRTWKHGNIRR